MRTIWKFIFPVLDRFTLEMPTQSIPLAVQMQDGLPCLWAEVETEMPKQRRTFAIYGTGNPIPDQPGDYIGTFQDSPFVWHLYELERSN